MTADGHDPTTAGGVIHDIGYRHYDGPRLGEGYIQRSLFTDSLRGAYGLGRSARSKVMPVLLLAATSVPALIIGVVVSVVGLSEVPGGYTGYPFSLQMVIGIYAAAQAPVLVSRDLRFRVVPLYFSRPLRRTQYVRAKYAAMAVAVFILIALPLTILLAGALLAELPWDQQLPEYLRALAAAVLYALVVAGIALVVAALTPRRGLGVAAVIAVLLVLSGVQGAVQAIASEFGRDTLAGYAGLISPFSLVDGVASTALGADGAVDVGPPGTLGAVVFALVALAVVAGCYAALQARYRRVATS